MRLLIFDSATHPVPYLSFDTPDYVVISLEQPELDHVQNSLKERVESAPSSLRRVGLPSGNEISRTIIFSFSFSRCNGCNNSCAPSAAPVPKGGEPLACCNDTATKPFAHQISQAGWHSKYDDRQLD